MDLNLNYSDDENPLSLKSDFILSLCELVVGGREGLQPIEKTVIDRAVRLIYQPFLNDPVPEKLPILADLYQALLDMEEKEAHRIATALEIYVTGSLNVFNHRTNVDITNRFVTFDIKELGKQLKKLGMMIVQDQVWGRVTANRNDGKATRYYTILYLLPNSRPKLPPSPSRALVLAKAMATTNSKSRFFSRVWMRK